MNPQWPYSRYPVLPPLQQTSWNIQDTDSITPAVNINILPPTPIFTPVSFPFHVPPPNIISTKVPPPTLCTNFLPPNFPIPVSNSSQLSSSFSSSVETLPPLPNDSPPPLPSEPPPPLPPTSPPPLPIDSPPPLPLNSSIPSAPCELSSATSTTFILDETSLIPPNSFLPMSNQSQTPVVIESPVSLAESQPVLCAKLTSVISNSSLQPPSTEILPTISDTTVSVGTTKIVSPTFSESSLLSVKSFQSTKLHIRGESFISVKSPIVPVISATCVSNDSSSTIQEALSVLNNPKSASDSESVSLMSSVISSSLSSASTEILGAMSSNSLVVESSKFSSPMPVESPFRSLTEPSILTMKSPPVTSSKLSGQNESSISVKSSIAEVDSVTCLSTDSSLTYNHSILPVLNTDPSSSSNISESISSVSPASPYISLPSALTETSPPVSAFPSVKSIQFSSFVPTESLTPLLTESSSLLMESLPITSSKLLSVQGSSVPVESFVAAPVSATYVSAHSPPVLIQSVPSSMDNFASAALGVTMISGLPNNSLPSEPAEILPIVTTTSSVESVKFSLPTKLTSPLTESSAFSRESKSNIQSRELPEEDEAFISVESSVTSVVSVTYVLSHSPPLFQTVSSSSSSTLNNSEIVSSNSSIVSDTISSLISVTLNNSPPSVTTEELLPMPTVSSSIESTKFSFIDPTKLLISPLTESSALPMESISSIQSRQMSEQDESYISAESAISLACLSPHSSPPLIQTTSSTLNSLEIVSPSSSVVCDSVSSSVSVIPSSSLLSTPTEVLPPICSISSSVETAKFLFTIPAKPVTSVLNESSPLFTELFPVLPSRILDQNKSPTSVKSTDSQVVSVIRASDDIFPILKPTLSVLSNSEYSVSDSLIGSESVSSIPSVGSNNHFSSIPTSSYNESAKFSSTIPTVTLNSMLTETSLVALNSTLSETSPTDSLSTMTTRLYEQEPSVSADASNTTAVSDTCVSINSLPAFIQSSVSSAINNPVSAASNLLPVSKSISSVSSQQKKQSPSICYVLVPISISSQSTSPLRISLRTINVQRNQTHTLQSSNEGTHSACNSTLIASPVIKKNIVSIDENIDKQLVSVPTSPEVIKTEESTFIHLAETMVTEPMIHLNKTASPEELLQDSSYSEDQNMVNFQQWQVMQEHNYCSFANVTESPEDNTEQNFQKHLPTDDSLFLSTVIARDHDYCLPSNESNQQDILKKEQLLSEETEINETSSILLNVFGEMEPNLSFTNKLSHTLSPTNYENDESSISKICSSYDKVINLSPTNHKSDEDSYNKSLNSVNKEQNNQNCKIIEIKEDKDDSNLEIKCEKIDDDSIFEIKHKKNDIEFDQRIECEKSSNDSDPELKLVKSQTENFSFSKQSSDINYNNEELCVNKGFTYQHCSDDFYEKISDSNFAIDKMKKSDSVAIFQSCKNPDFELEKTESVKQNNLCKILSSIMCSNAEYNSEPKLFEKQNNDTRDHFSKIEKLDDKVESTDTKSPIKTSEFHENIYFKSENLNNQNSYLNNKNLDSCKSICTSLNTSIYSDIKFLTSFKDVDSDAYKNVDNFDSRKNIDNSDSCKDIDKLDSYKDIGALNSYKNIDNLNCNKNDIHKVDNPKEYCLNVSIANFKNPISDLQENDSNCNQNNSDQNYKEIKDEDTHMKLDMKHDNFKSVISDFDVLVNSKDIINKESSQNLLSDIKNHYNDSENEIKNSNSKEQNFDYNQDSNKSIEDKLKLPEDNSYKITNLCYNQKETNLNNEISWLPKSINYDSRLRDSHKDNDNALKKRKYSNSHEDLSKRQHSYLGDHIRKKEHSHRKKKHIHSHRNHESRDHNHSVKIHGKSEKSYSLESNKISSSPSHRSHKKREHSHLIKSHRKSGHHHSVKSLRKSKRSSSPHLPKSPRKHHSDSRRHSPHKKKNVDQRDNLIRSRKDYHCKSRSPEKIKNANSPRIRSPESMKNHHLNSKSPEKMKTTDSTRIKSSESIKNYHHNSKSPEKIKASSSPRIRSPEKIKTTDNSRIRSFESIKNYQHNNRSPEKIKASNSPRIRSPESVKNYHHSSRSPEKLKVNNSPRIRSPGSIKNSGRHRSRSIESLKSNFTHHSRSPKSIKRLHDRHYSKSPKVSVKSTDTEKSFTKDIENKEKSQSAGRNKERHYEEIKKMRRQHRSRHKRSTPKHLPLEVTKVNEKSADTEKIHNNKYVDSNKDRLQSVNRDILSRSKERHKEIQKIRRQRRSRRRSSTPKDLPCLSLKTYKYVCSTPADGYYSSNEKDSKEVVAKDALKTLHDIFRFELVERAERVRASKPKYEPPKRKTKLRKPKPPKTDSNSDSSSSSSEKSSSDEEDTSMEELERKKKHPYRLHLELWFNDPKEMNDGPLCRCSAKARRAGIRHGIYVGEDHLPLCDPLSNNVNRLYHYRITMTPQTNFLTKNPTTIYHNGLGYRFEGFSMFSHSKLPPLPNCKVIRFNYEYTIVYAEEEFPKNFTIEGLELFSRYLLIEILELVDLNWKAHDDPDGCPRFHFMPRFARELKDGGKELLSHCYVLEYLLKQNQILVDESKLAKILTLNNHDWQDLADEVKGMIVTCPGMKPSSIRVDQLDREQCNPEKEEFPVIVHFGVRPPQLSYAGNPHYQKAWRDYVKYRHLLANKPKVRYADRHKLLQKESRLQEMRMENDLKRDVTVVISSKDFYKTGIMSDIVQHAMLLPVLVCHLRFHQSLTHLENKLGYKFKDRFLLQLALTHPSYRENFGTNPDHARNSLTNCGLRQPQYGDRRIHYMNTRKRGINTLINIMSRFGSRKETLSRINHNERLEFLGDAVVEFLSSIHLFYMFPDLEEGGLATYRAAIVQNQHLAVLSKKLELDRFMLYAHGSDLCHDLELRHAMANCFEALMGALFLDNGIEIADKVFSKTLFSEQELLEVWMNFSPHPLQEQEPGGDRKWIESVPLLQKLHQFEETIGIEFNHIRLLARALTHRSLGYNNLTLGSNQRLEFLGDTVLQLVASEYLYKFFPEHHEGHLSLLRSSLVNNRTQAVVCADLGMVDYAIYPYDKVELKPKDKADLLEAFLGALYVDKDLGFCRKFCEVCFFPRLQDFIMNQDWNDPKSKLQQCCLTLRSMDGGEPDIPTYKVIECKGPTNTRVYSVAVYFQGNRLAVGSGHSIQQAEMDAASNALDMSKDLFPQLRHQRRAIERSLKKRPLNRNRYSPRKSKGKITDINKHSPKKDNENTSYKRKRLPTRDAENTSDRAEHSLKKDDEKISEKIRHSSKKDKEKNSDKTKHSPKNYKEKHSSKSKHSLKREKEKSLDKIKLSPQKYKEKYFDKNKHSSIKDKEETSGKEQISTKKDCS